MDTEQKKQRHGPKREVEKEGSVNDFTRFLSTNPEKLELNVINND